MATVAKRRKQPVPPEPPAPWPARLKALRARLRLTQAEAAARIRVGLRTWLSWERDEQTPSPPFVLLIELLEAEKI